MKGKPIYQATIRIGLMQGVEPLLAAVAPLTVDVGLAFAVAVTLSVQSSGLGKDSISTVSPLC